MYSRLAWTSAGKDQSWQVIIQLFTHVGFFQLLRNLFNYYKIACKQISTFGRAEYILIGVRIKGKFS